MKLMQEAVTRRGTKKRIIWIALIIAIILVAGFFTGWLAWLGRDWLERPDGLTAIFTVFAGVGTVGTVIVALFGIRYERKKAQEDRLEAQRRFENEQNRAREELREERNRFDKAQAESQRQFLESQQQTRESLEESRRQFLEAQYAANRPILMPNGEWFPNREYGKRPVTFDWNDTEQPSIQIINEGAGIATNVLAVFMYPEAISSPVYPYLSQLRFPIPCKEKKYLEIRIRETLLNSSDRIIEKGNKANFSTLGIPKELSLEGHSDQIHRRIARLVITYHDIFDRKYASIFDYTNMAHWVCVAFIPNIEDDLAQLEIEKGGLWKESPPQTVKKSHRVY